MTKAQIILASGSPRRRQFLEEMLGTDSFLIVPADIPEPLPEDVSAEENAKSLSLAKAKTVQQQYPDAIIIASDTIVAIENKQLGKAETRLEAEAMLRSLQGKVSQVVTGLVILAPGQEIIDVDSTDVIFRPADAPGAEKALQEYLDSDDWRGKAGSYGIQSGASPLIESIRGHISTIIGLPVEKLAKHLRSEFNMRTKAPASLKIPAEITNLTKLAG